jgi:hypothetical protein
MRRLSIALVTCLLCGSLLAQQPAQHNKAHCFRDSGTTLIGLTPGNAAILGGCRQDREPLGAFPGVTA